MRFRNSDSIHKSGESPDYLTKRNDSTPQKSSDYFSASHKAQRLPKHTVMAAQKIHLFGKP
jgi:hypothetical protein